MSTAELPLVDEVSSDAPAPRSIIIIDGYQVDEETGEIVGLAERDETFTPDTPDKADWVLEKIAIEEAEALALTARFRAVQDNLDRLRKQREARAKFLRWKFGPNLEDFARRQLANAGGKSRTYTLTHGSISFRKVNESFSVGDMDKVVAFVEDIDASLVRVVKSTTAKQAKQAAEFIGQELEDVPGIVRTPEHETCTIKTGVVAP